MRQPTPRAYRRVKTILPAACRIVCQVLAEARETSMIFVGLQSSTHLYQGPFQSLHFMQREDLSSCGFCLKISKPLERDVTCDQFGRGCIDSNSHRQLGAMMPSQSRSSGLTWPGLKVFLLPYDIFFCRSHRVLCQNACNSIKRGLVLSVSSLIQRNPCPAS